MNGPTHRLIAGSAVGIFLARKEAEDGVLTFKPIAGGAAAAVLTNFPDLLEPATSPNHRAFFHSLTFAAVLAAGLYKLNQWQPESKSDKFWKDVGMLAGSAYLIHLALDFTTNKSLPLFGRA